jgi:phage repressor protein C with HTH and peptisase S24 domain
MQRACRCACRQNAPMTDKERIRAWYLLVLRETKWSAAQWARLAKTSPSNITRLHKDPNAASPRTDTLQKLLRVVPQTLKDQAPNFLFGDTPVVGLAEAPAEYVASPPSAKSSRSIPVLGSRRQDAMEEGFFTFDGAEVSRVKTPPALAEVKGAYALYVQGDSMEPRYFQGDLVYINPIQPPRLNDFVVVTLHRRFEGDQDRAAIKRMVGGDEVMLTFEQYHPSRIDDIARSAVRTIHRILNGDELW